MYRLSGVHGVFADNKMYLYTWTQTACVWTCTWWQITSYISWCLLTVLLRVCLHVVVWSSGSTPDCGVRDPGLNPSCVLALTEHLYAVPMSTQPSTHLSGWAELNNSNKWWWLVWTFTPKSAWFDGKRLPDAESAIFIVLRPLLQHDKTLW